MGAAVEENNDMLLLQWGAAQLLELNEPTDLRLVDDAKLVFADFEVDHLDFTRQVFAPGGSTDAKFDDDAVQMSITLGFNRTEDGDPGSHLWIQNPDGLDRAKKRFLETRYVSELLNRECKTVSITVSRCN